jgi:hypothetical protein
MQYLYYPVVGAFYVLRAVFSTFAFVTFLVGLACEAILSVFDNDQASDFFDNTPTKLKEYFNAAPSEDN